jgi:DNA gyrase subunit B
MSEEMVVLEDTVELNGAKESYTPSDVEVKRDAAHIRQRPGMYIGDTGTKGLHHLVYELIGNSVDEALAGFCKSIHVRIKGDGSLSVSDDGRGIPVEEHATEKRPTLEVVMTTVGAGAKFSKGTYRFSGGLHGMGAKAVTALSEWTEAQVQRNGKTYRQDYERGKAVTGVMEIGQSKRTGTTVTFKPDPEIFHNVTFDYDTLESRLRELAFLNKGLTIGLHDELTNKDEVFKYDGGLAEFVKYLNREEKVLHEPLYIDKVVEGVRVEIALQYCASEEERVRCYTNNAFNSIGGTHLSGFRAAITRTLNAYGAQHDLFKNVTPAGEDYREGLTVLLSVLVPEPQFDSQEKKRLNNLEVEGIVSGVVGEALGTYLEEKPKDAQAIMKKALVAAEAREAAAKAKKALKDRKSILSGGGLPGKLFDCTERDPDKSELFLVEGDSAGGSAEAGRDRAYQAVLPLRGKPLNVEKARVENLLNNEEICSLISAIGIDIGNTEDIEKLRYSKVIIMTDADVDGQHIRTLLLTLFYRQMWKLIDEGHIYVARPPLYKVTQKKNVRFIQSNEEMTGELMERGLKGTDLVALSPQPADGQPAPAPRKFEEANLAALVKLMARLEDSLVLLERSGLNLITFLARVTPQGLPVYRVLLGGREQWFFTQEEVDAFRQREEERLGRELVVVDDSTPAPVNGQTNGHAEMLDVRELHEVRKVNRALEELKRYGLLASDLIPAPRVAGREPPPRLVLENGDQKRQLPHLRDLVSEIRKIGERGLTITRFKGLGEMDPEELWETTLDPAKRTLMKVELDDAGKADELFRVLMGEKVEDRRNFIIEHGMKAKDIDYHGA